MYSSISATDLAQWADRREAQSQLPVLVRRLLHGSDLKIAAINFPGGDSVQLGGFDGALETATGTIWVPSGKSAWELGCNRKVRQKAESDYQKRTEGVPLAHRLQSTFVFVTPRRWTVKDKWVAAKRSARQWADVRCLDADDLEQWIETTPAAHAWIARTLGRAFDGVLSGSQFWASWSGAATPAILEALVLAGRDAFVSKLVARLAERRATSITVAADSRQEALAFVCAALASRPPLSDRLLVLDDEARIEDLGSLDHHVLALASAALEHRVAHLATKVSLVTPVVRGQAGGEVDIDLGPIKGDLFDQCLSDLGLPQHRIAAAARESGRSITVLRRRWALTPALAQPKWSGESEIARKLVPFALCGAWNLDRDGDIKTLAAIGDLSVHQVERDATELLAIDEAPIEAIGRRNRVVSQIDALFAVGRRLTKPDLDRFFSVVERAIGVRDPALDLPEDERWMANVLGKEHPFSGALLHGIGNTLVLFAIHGDAICGRRLGVDLQGRTSALVSRLLSNLTGEQWVSIRGNLRLLAEAAPAAFLTALEQDLATAQPGVMALMPVTSSGVTSDCLRTELLWALEIVAWSPVTYGRAVDVLARLSRIPLNDNWMNKPVRSLHSLFRSWLPKTAVPVETRIATLTRLFGSEPAVAFGQAMMVVDTRHAMASDNARPRWRDDAADAGHGASEREYRDMILAASDLLLTRSTYSLEQLQGLVEIVGCFTAAHQVRLWRIVQEWTVAAADRDKAALRETLRRFVLRQKRRGQAAEAAEAAFRNLEPAGLGDRHRWLFDKHWLDFAADELGDHPDHEARQQRTDERRLAALNEIVAQDGDDGLFRFALAVKLPGLVAFFMARKLADPVAPERVRSLMDDAAPGDALSAFRRGYLAAVDPATLISLLQGYADRFGRGALSEGAYVDILCDAPGGKRVWDFAAAGGASLQSRYWSVVNVGWADWSAEDIEIVIEHLLQVERPRSAFFAIRLNKKLVSSKSMHAVLHAVMTVDEPGVSLPDAHDLADAFKILDADSALDREAIARLEFGFSAALIHTERGQPVLERQLARDPAQYVRMLSYIYRRDDDGVDPEDWIIADEQQARNVGQLCMHVLEHWNVVRMLSEGGALNVDLFRRWVAECREVAARVARSGIADLKIGTMLALKTQDDGDGWPAAAICDVLESVATDAMRDGFSTGVFNSRGMTSRHPFEGGRQERALAQRYDAYASALEIRWPKVSATLRALAEGYRRDAEWNDRLARLNEIRDL